MMSVMIAELLVIFLFLFLIVVLYLVCKKTQMQNKELKEKIIKAEGEVSYLKKVNQLKDEAYRNAKEKNKKLDEGTKRERIVAAGDGLCNG